MNRIVAVILKKSMIEHLLFLVLGVMAVCFFEERLCADSSYYIIRVINHESIWVEHNRFILMFSQWLPLIGVKLGLGTKAVLCLYSIGHVIFFYVIFLIAKYRYKNEYAGVLLLLLQTLGIMSGFFVPMFELYYCAGLLILISSILYYSNKRIDLIILGILCFFILTGHPYASILLFLIVALHIEQFRLKYFKYYLLILALVISVFIFKKYNVTEYEQGKALAFMYNLEHATYDFAYLKALIIFLIKNYWELLSLGFITIAVLIYRRNYWKTAIIVLAFAGTLAMINVSYYGFELSRYQEQVYFPLSFIVAYPFAIYLLKTKQLKSRAIFSFVALLLMLVRMQGIFVESENFRGRVEEMKQNIALVRPMKGSKFVINDSDLKYPANWSYPIETLLFSSYDRNQKTVTICTKEDYDFGQNKSVLKPTQYLFRRWEIYPVESLNKRYFRLDHSAYVILDSNKVVQNSNKTPHQSF